MKRRNMIRRSTLLILLMSAILLIGQKPVAPLNIQIKMKGMRDTTLYLANYYGDKILKVDSVRLNHEGLGMLNRNKAQKEGMYLFYLNDKNYFEFLIGRDQQFTIDADFSNSPQNKFTDSDETAAFHEYQLLLGRQKTEQSLLQNRIKLLPEKSDSMKIVQKELSELNNTMENYWKEMSGKYKGTFLADFFLSMIIPRADEPTIPLLAKNPDSL